MVKKILAASAATLMLAGVASAATTEVNIYGASAQYLFWNDTADDFMASKGCTNISQAKSSDGTQGITLGKACSGFGGNDLIIRYTAKASFDGIMAMKNTEHPDAPTTCTNKAQRPMADETKITGTVVTGTKCVDVTLGASDVAAEAFIQISSGNLKGPAGGGVVNRNFAANPVDGSGLTTYNPVVVPFAPFLSKDVTLSTCGDGLNAGEMCQTDADCPGFTAGNGCTAGPVENLSREMLVNIFSGQGYYWNDFGQGFPAEPITACLRHAGSGTHATLDLAVMNSSWGASVVQAQSAADPIIWFNDGSSDEMRCINGNFGTKFAIGYADADQLVGTTAYPNVYRPKYNGFTPSRVNIRNGLYDWFSAQWLYEDPSEPNFAKTHPVVDALIAFASDPAKIPATKAGYWAAQGEMTWFKNSDFSYPAFRGATIPQVP